MAADYYRALAQIEARLELGESPTSPVPDPSRLLALVDSLSTGTLNESQWETVQALRVAILALAEELHRPP